MHPSASGRGGTLGGGGGGGAPRMLSSRNLPRTTGEVRVEYDVTVRMLPWPSNPRRRGSLDRHAPEVTAVHVREAVEFRQPFIDERVVRRQELHQRPIVPHLALEEHLGLGNKGLAQVFVEIRKHPRIRLHHPHVAQLQPLAREIAHQRRRAAVGEHPPDLLFQDLRIFQLAARRGLEQFSSGMLLQRKNDSRDASSRSVMR